MRLRPGITGIAGLSFCCLLHATGHPEHTGAAQKVAVTKTEHADFPAGGTLHLKNSVGDLTIEGWDEPGMEITTIKSSKVAVEGMEKDKAVKLLDSVKITTERKGDEVIVSTAFPKHGKIARPFQGFTDFDLEYVIKVPRAAKVTVEHTMGEVHIDEIGGEIHAIDGMGLIGVRVPDGQYAIDAMTKIGAVNSDFPGTEQSRKWIGQTFLGDAKTAPQKLFLRIKYGDIIVMRMHQPAPPSPGTASGK
jgi:hypothetical protein